MPNRIHLLDETLINKIAAGEVIENSSSVVKELIENAVDAGSTNIEVITKGGGRALIQISDNGSGIEKEDLPLALYRHATSKIKTFDDLFSLNSFGFRGEALASIAAVSKIEISTSTGTTCHKILAEGGTIISNCVHSRKKGSTIEVRDLFFNLPVRRNFQKSLKAEVKDIEKVLIQTALVHREIHLKWINDGKEEFQLFAGRETLSTIETFFGKEWSDNIFPIHAKKRGIELSGFISQPHFTRGNKTGQYLFVNKRAIYSTLVSEAILQGYGTRLSTSRYPNFVLFLEIDPSHIDVNVHPQKKEIRFQDEKSPFNFLKESVEKALEMRYKPLVPTEKMESIAASPIVLKPIALKTAQVVPEIKTASFFIKAIVEDMFLIEKEGVPFIISCVHAQKRILFERIRNKKCCPMQSLLFPITIELSHTKRKVLENNLDLFQALHISIRPLGEESFVIDALPVGMDEEKIFSLLEETTLEKKDLEKKMRISLNHLYKRKKWNFEEANKLVETLFLCEEPFICPEGRPTMIPWPKEEIKRLFL